MSDHWLLLSADLAADGGQGGPAADRRSVLAVRLYGALGLPYPRPALSLLDRTVMGGGVKVSVSRRDAPAEEWRDCGLPRELPRDLAGMFLALALAG
jgi:hypothetical protein